MNGRWSCDRDDDVRTVRDDLPGGGDQHIPALCEPEGVPAASPRPGSRGRPGGQRPGLDPDTTQHARLASAVWPLDRTSRAGFHNSEDEGG